MTSVIDYNIKRVRGVCDDTRQKVWIALVPNIDATPASLERLTLGIDVYADDVSVRKKFLPHPYRAVGLQADLKKGANVLANVPEMCPVVDQVVMQSLGRKILR